MTFSPGWKTQLRSITMMISRFVLPALAAAFVAGAAAGFAAPGGAGGSATAPSSVSGTVGTGGSAAAGGTSASSLGLGAASTTPSQSSSALGVGGSAASGNGGHVRSRSGVHGNPNSLNGQSMDQAHEQGGVWSKSHTHTHIHHGVLSSRTKSMSHVPGGPPSQSTSGSTVDSGR
jgi:hypothetical protein